jgi:hypothetical protein
MELSGGKPLGRSSLAQVVHRRHAVGTEGMEVRIDRIGMDLQEVSNLDGSQTGSIQQNCFSPSALAGRKRTFQHLVKLPDV